MRTATLHVLVLATQLAACQSDSVALDGSCVERCDGQGSDASAPPPASVPVATKPWHTFHGARFLGLFAVPVGVMIVHARGASVLARDETESTAWASSRELSAAAFDGTHLAVSSATELEIRSAQFDSLRAVTLEGRCDFAAFAASDTVICAPNASESVGTVSTYDIVSGTLVGRSLGLQYEGAPSIRVVPGRAQLVQYRSGLGLYAMEAAGQLRLLGKAEHHSARHAEFLHVTEPTLVTDGGELLRLSDSLECDAEPSGCFRSAGLLGKGTNEVITLIHPLRDGGVFTVVYPNDRGPSARRVIAIQRYDLTTRAIVAQKVYDFGDDLVIAVQYDEVADKLWTALAPNSWTPGSSFRVLLLDYR